MEEVIHLLVIDVSTSGCEAVLNIFRDQHLLVKHQQATNAQNTFEALRSQRWDAIIIDCKMLDLAGLSIYGISQQCFENTPVILTGDNISDDLAVKSIKAGASHCLNKNRLECLLPIVKRGGKARQANKQLDRSPSELKELISAAEKSRHEFYLINAQNLKLTYSNSQAKQSLGYTSQELHDLKLNQLYPDHTEESLKRLIRPLLDGSRSKISVCTWQKRKSGNLYPVELQLQTANDHTSIVSIICSDLTDRREEVGILNQQRERADRYARINKEQTEMIANVNHDLRTCLNSIILLSKNLASENSGLDTKQLDYANTIQQSSTDLLELVDEVLDLSKIQSTKKSMQTESIDTQNVCQKLEKKFAPIARDNNISFSYAILDNSCETINTNRICIERILKNVLSNAFKFTQKGSVTINIYSPSNAELQDLNIDGDNIAFQIQDTGIGIAEEKQDLIFQRFQQAEDSTQKEYGGSGLGLAICQDLTRQLGGTMRVQSTPGQGSTFTVYLPQKEPSQGQQSSKAPTLKTNIESEAKEYPLDGTVLLVDDCQMHNMALQEFLSYKIPNCISVSTAKEAYQVIDKHFIDCLVLDMSLDNTNGHEIMTYLKTQKEYESIPIIIYTGKNLSATEKEKLSQYADSIINKSVGSYKVLQGKILSILSKSAIKTEPSLLP